VGTNGVIIPPAGYLEGVRRLCDRHGILLIADEVMTGFGRTGAWFAVDHWGVIPDLMTMAKGLTSGYLPLGAVAMSEKVASTFRDRVFQGGLTFNGHPLCLAAAIANLRVLQEDGLIDRARILGEDLAGHLRALRQDHPSVGEVRSLGLFGAIELVQSRSTREPLAPFNASSPAMDAVARSLRQAGLFLFIRGHILLIVPPLTISREQLAEGFGLIDEALRLADHAVVEEAP
jgi:taurine--2-oxoglutarate transaminase